MRLKHVKGAEEAVAASEFVVQKPEELRGKWCDFFKNDRPIYIEIGMGKGRFIMETASLHPDINYIGMERSSSVALRAVQKMEEAPMTNLRFICADAGRLEEYFAPGEISKIYLNFSDPWPKKRHANRRLTFPRFLRHYETVLENGGTLEFKTDNTVLFDYSLESLEHEGWDILALTRDLHHDPVMNEGNIMTEYEEKFSAQGNPICRLIASKSAK